MGKLSWSAAILRRPSIAKQSLKPIAGRRRIAALQGWSILLIVCLLFSGCNRIPLSCRSEYLGPNYLASAAIDTPDPLQACFMGQQIVVRWNLPSQAPCPTTLRLSVRFGTREIETFTTPINNRNGYWIFRLLNQDYVCKQGIVSFKAEIFNGDVLLSSWRHFLWADIIEISPDL